MTSILPGPAHQEPPRRKGPWIITAAAVLVAALVAVLVIVSRPWEPRAGAPTTPASPSTPASAPVTAGAEAVNGCLIGTNATTKALLNAQSHTPHTQQGAIALAAATTSWMLQVPRIPQAEGEKALKSLLASTADPAHVPDPKALAAAKFSPGLNTARVSFSSGKYLIHQSTPDEVTVSVAGTSAYNGSLYAQDRPIGTFHLVWEKNAWRIQSTALSPDAQKTLDLGSDFQGGC